MGYSKKNRSPRYWIGPSQSIFTKVQIKEVSIVQVRDILAITSNFELPTINSNYITWVKRISKLNVIYVKLGSIS
ncbi:hypothetical protein D3C81_1831780 [compost metagenome]